MLAWSHNACGRYHMFCRIGTNKKSSRKASTGKCSTSFESMSQATCQPDAAVEKLQEPWGPGDCLHFASSCVCCLWQPKLAAWSKCVLNYLSSRASHFTLLAFCKSTGNINNRVMNGEASSPRFSNDVDSSTLNIPTNTAQRRRRILLSGLQQSCSGVYFISEEAHGLSAGTSQLLADFCLVIAPGGESDVHTMRCSRLTIVKYNDL